MSWIRLRWFVCVVWLLVMGGFSFGGGCLPAPPVVECRPCGCGSSADFVCVSGLCVKTENQAKAQRDIKSVCGNAVPTEPGESNADVASEPPFDAPVDASPDVPVEPSAPDVNEILDVADAGPVDRSEPVLDAREPMADRSEPMADVVTPEPKRELPPEPACPPSKLCPNQKGMCKGATSSASTCQNGQWACSEQDYKSHFAKYSTKDDTCDGIDNDCSGLADQDAIECVITVVGPPAIRNGPKAQALFQVPWRMVRSSKGEWFISDSANRVIRKIDQNGNVTVFAGTGEKGRMNGAGNVAQFDFPAGIAIDKKDFLYVVDRNQSAIRKIDPKGNVSLLAGSVNGLRGYVNGAKDAARFTYPDDIAIDESGGTLKIYVSDYGNHVIRLIDDQGNVTTVAGLAPGASKEGLKNGLASQAMFSRPAGLHLVGKDLYITEHGNHVIRKLSGGLVSTYAGVGGFGLDDGPFASAKFASPMGITGDGQGKLYVVDAASGILRELDMATKAVKSLTSPLQSSPKTCQWSSLAAARFRLPFGLRFYQGKLYVTDQVCNQIVEVDLATKAVGVWAGLGTPGKADGPGAKATLALPRSLVLNKAGNTMYIAEFDTGEVAVRIRKAVLDAASQTWTVSTYFANPPGPLRSDDGKPGQFFRLSGLVLDEVGNRLYAYSPWCVRFFDLSTDRLLTLAGHCQIRGFIDGIGANARFNGISSMTFAPDRKSFYVTEIDNHSVRKIVLGSGAVMRVAGSVDGSGNPITNDPKKPLPAATAPLNTLLKRPVGIAFDKNGAMYVADSGNNVIRKLVGGKLEIFLGPSISVNFPSSYTLSLVSPGYLEWRGDTLYFINRNFHQFVSHTTSSMPSRTAVYGTIGPRVGNGDIAKAQFVTPESFAVGPNQSLLYGLGVNSHRVRRIRIK